MERYICIHGHFYQPPRENPWTGTVEQQSSASPYHDWNERITAECYASNASSPILDGDGQVVRALNNYARMSFNFGPTLLSWMERHKPDVYHAIIEADRVSRKRFSGHGSAITQIYNHMIMPLANQRDKKTQAIWGVADFQKRFGRSPEGMWLPETAVDLETLEALAEVSVPGVHAVMVGEGPERATLVMGRARLPAGAPSLHLPGVRRDAASLMSAFDVLVISSRTEGTPLVLLEAMSAGVPVVSFAVGGIPDVLDENTGSLVTPGDVHALAAAIGDTLLHRTEAGRRAERARALVNERFGIEPWEARIESVYRSVVV